jgi:putative sigma-54 modulation protein
MNYNIKGTEVAITPELREYVERRLASHVDKFLARDTTAHADVELQYEAVRDGGRYRAEFTVSAGGELYRAQEWGTAMHEAIDLAISRLSGELARNKKKRLHVLRHSAVKVKEFLRGWRTKL